MRKLKLQVQISLDGYIADRNGKTDWMIWNWGPEWTWDTELRNYFIELNSSVDCVLLSRKMAEEGFINHWNTVASDLKNPQSAFARYIDDAYKIVFSNTLKKAQWPNTKIAGKNFTEEIKYLKKLFWKRYYRIWRRFFCFVPDQSGTD